MKEWKTIVVVLLLVAVMGCQPVVISEDAIKTSQDAKALSDLKERIGQLIVLKEEQALTRDIMVIQQEVRVLQLKAQAPPVIEGEFIPMDKLPKDLQD